MIDLSECFSMVGTDGCIDVASSLGMQGIDPSLGELSIPIYEIFYLKILFGQDCSFICDNLREVAALQKLNQNCGSVTITLNLLNMDILTLVGALLIATPNTGMNVFVKLSAVDLLNLSSDVIEQLAGTMGIPMEVGVMTNFEELAAQVLDAAFSRVIDSLNEDLSLNGIELREWNELPDFYNELLYSGEMKEMGMYRRQIGAFVF